MKQPLTGTLADLQSVLQTISVAQLRRDIAAMSDTERDRFLELLAGLADEVIRAALAADTKEHP